jgi:hypothetical protein
MSGLPPEAYASVFKVLSEKRLSPIVVGGQAVNLWATVYEAWDAANNPEPVLLQQYRPFVSKDLDLTAISNHQISFLPGVVERHIPPRQFRNLAPDTGSFFFEVEGIGRIRVEILSRVLGADNDEIEQHAVTLELAGTPVRVPDPLVVLKCKIANAATLPQTSRSDVPQLQMMIRCVRAYIGEDVQNGVEARKILKLIERLDTIRKHRYTKSAATKYSLDFAKCLPVPQLLERVETDEKIRNYLHHQLGMATHGENEKLRPSKQILTQRPPRPDRPPGSHSIRP